MIFDDLGLSNEVLKAVNDAGYTEPTPIQEKAIPHVLMGRDILGCAQTGTGKTASFTLPMIDILASGRARARMPRTLILEPTRELATQVAENFDVYGKYTSLAKALIIGGESMGEQVKILDRGVDVLIATLGKAFGVNGGYVTGSATLTKYLRETSPFYIYSNPITPGEAAAALKAVEIVDSPAGQALIDHLRTMTARFESGLVALGYETIPGAHPVVPLMVRDTARTSALVIFLRTNGLLATGLNFPVVPQGDEEIRFQVSADHTEADIDEALALLAAFAEQEKKGA